jgi:regulator of RNase E activity RraA
LVVEGTAGTPEIHARRIGAPGARIRAEWPRPDREVIRRFGTLPISIIGDAMHRLGAMHGQIRSLWPGAASAGPAVPVWVRAGDNALIHQAIALAQPGDVLVINAQGSTAHAVFGELMALKCLVQGVAGVVIDGVVRDVEDLAALKFPVFARGACASGPLKDGTGEVGYPIACGGVVCAPGDVVLADGDGVVIVPIADAVSVLRHAESIAVWEQERRAELIAQLPDRAGPEPR